MSTNRRIMIIAGEVSGDMHAAGLVMALKEKLPGSVFFGIGGAEMRKAGVETFYDIKDMAVMGLVEVLRRFSFFRKVFYHMLDIARERKPDVVVLVDYPGFNRRFAAKVHAMGIKTVYYICPQVWAWNRSRIPKMAKTLDRLITIFPFEKDIFTNTGLKVDFAGHPLVDEARKAMAESPPVLPWNGKPQVALLPGSRTHVILNILPAMWEAAKLIEKKHPSASFIIPAPTPQAENTVRTVIKTLPSGPSRWNVVTGNTRQVLRQAAAAVVASGTATIETSFMECPMVVVYKTSLTTYLIGKMLVAVDNIGMVNIVAGKKICPELLQSAASPEAIADAIDPLLSDTPARREMIDELRKVNAVLGQGNASGNAAGFIAEELSVN